ncbi:hypothetical protein [Cupriavidus sp. AcVe19-6a]|uniref:hypothetical protein n=1 Tax=Cupriavidus sp. AcVe19-6a TaxID=2821358 RepID=UPI001AE70F3B|nr:hypothetical protein [Cupriavidus sp. AcVe19-6a]MBP0634253.1 hypothetical protein [Cupriavidus sp. AcVe19-6a]
MTMPMDASPKRLPVDLGAFETGSVVSQAALLASIEAARCNYLRALAEMKRCEEAVDRAEALAEELRVHALALESLAREAGAMPPPDTPLC